MSLEAAALISLDEVGTTIPIGKRLMLYITVLSDHWFISNFLRQGRHISFGYRYYDTLR